MVNADLAGLRFEQKRHQPMNELAATEKLFDLTGKRVFVAGHRGMVGSAIVRAVGRARGCDVLTVGRDQADLRRQEQTETRFCRTTAACSDSCSGKSWGDLCQRRLSRRIHLRQSGDRDERHPQRLSSQGGKTSLSWLILHLSATSATADEGRRIAHRPTRANQSVVRDREDRGR